MAVPRNRLSNARKNSRRAHHALSKKQTMKCNGCGAKKLPHTLCPSCGAYGNGLNYGSDQEQE